MRNKHYSTGQIVAALMQAKMGLPVADLVRELKQLLDENARLKKLVAKLGLDKAVLQGVQSKKFPGHRS